MDMQSNEIRALSTDECDDVSGGVGWLVALAVLAGAAAIGSAVAILTKEEKVLVPHLDLPD